MVRLPLCVVIQQFLSTKLEPGGIRIIGESGSPRAESALTVVAKYLQSLAVTVITKICGAQTTAIQGFERIDPQLIYETIQAAETVTGKFSRGPCVIFESQYTSTKQYPLLTMTGLRNTFADVIQNPNVPGQKEITRILSPEGSAAESSFVSAIGALLGEYDRVYQAHIHLVHSGGNPDHVLKILDTPWHVKLRKVAKKLLMALLEHTNGFKPPSLDEITKIFVLNDG